MVKVCCCGSYPTMDGALANGRYNDCDGCESTATRSVDRELMMT